MVEANHTAERLGPVKVYCKDCGGAFSVWDTLPDECPVCGIGFDNFPRANYYGYGA